MTTAMRTRALLEGGPPGLVVVAVSAPAVIAAATVSAAVVSRLRAAAAVVGRGGGGGRRGLRRVDRLRRRGRRPIVRPGGRLCRGWLGHADQQGTQPSDPIVLLGGAQQHDVDERRHGDGGGGDQDPAEGEGTASHAFRLGGDGKSRDRELTPQVRELGRAIGDEPGDSHAAGIVVARLEAVAVALELDSGPGAGAAGELEPEPELVAPERGRLRVLASTWPRIARAVAAAVAAAAVQ